MRAIFSVYKVCIRCLHDNQLSPTCQSMYAKLMMNLSEPLVAADDVDGHKSACAALMMALFALVEKTRTIASFHLPTLIAAVERAKRDAAAAPSQPPPPPPPPSPQKPTTSSGGEAADQRPPPSQAPAALGVQKSTMDIKVVRHMIKQLLQSIKLIAQNLSRTTTDARKPTRAYFFVCKSASLETRSAFAKRELYANLFVNGLRCLEIFKLTPSQAQTTPQTKLHLQKDELETMELFANVVSAILHGAPSDRFARFSLSRPSRPSSSTFSAQTSNDSSSVFAPIPRWRPSAIIFLTRKTRRQS